VTQKFVYKNTQIFSHRRQRAKIVGIVDVLFLKTGHFYTFPNQNFPRNKTRHNLHT